MTNEQATAVVASVNKMFEELGISERYRLSWDNELCNEAIAEGTIADIDTTDEFVLGIRYCKNGTYLTFCAEKSARHYLRHEARVGDYIKARVYLKPAMFKGDWCYLHVDDEANVLKLIHEGGEDNVD